MIQRVQSLFLIAVVVCLVTAQFFPVWQKLDATGETGALLKVTHTEIYSPPEPVSREYFPTAVLGLLILVGIVVAVVALFRFRNRMLQLKLGAVNSLVLAGFLGLSVYFTFRMEQMIPLAGEGTYDFGMYLPAAALICNLLANRFIRKDEALVRSVDRIR